MKASVGDRIVIRGRHTGQPVRAGRVVEVRGDEGPFVVHWEDSGHETLYFPGTDAVVEAKARAARPSGRRQSG